MPAPSQTLLERGPSSKPWWVLPPLYTDRQTEAGEADDFVHGGDAGSPPPRNQPLELPLRPRHSPLPLLIPGSRGPAPGAGVAADPLFPPSPELCPSLAAGHSPSFPSLGPALTLGGVSVSGRTQDGGFGLGPGPSEVGSEFWRMTAPRAPGAAGGVGTAGSGSWEAGKAARFRVGWSCRDWDRGTGAAYGFSGTRCATRLCRERPGRVGCPLCGTSPPGSGGPGLGGRGQGSLWLPSVRGTGAGLPEPDSRRGGRAPGKGEPRGRAHAHARADGAPAAGAQHAAGDAHLVRSLLGLHRPLHRRSLGKGARGRRGGLGGGGLRPGAARLGLGQGGVLLLVHPRPLFHLRCACAGLTSEFSGDSCPPGAPPTPRARRRDPLSGPRRARPRGSGSGGYLAGPGGLVGGTDAAAIVVQRLPVGGRRRRLLLQLLLLLQGLEVGVLLLQLPLQALGLPLLLQLLPLVLLGPRVGAAAQRGAPATRASPCFPPPPAGGRDGRLPPHPGAPRRGALPRRSTAPAPARSSESASSHRKRGPRYQQQGLFLEQLLLKDLELPLLLL